MERDMSEAPTTERPRGPDLSGLKIDERGRRDPTRRGWRAGGAALAAFLLVSAGLFLVLREKAPVVEVTTARAGKGGRPALLNASGYGTPPPRAPNAAKNTAPGNQNLAEAGM